MTVLSILATITLIGPVSAPVRSASSLSSPALSVMTAPHQAQLAFLTDTVTQWVRVQSITPNFNPQWGLGENTRVAEFMFNPGSGHYYRNVLLTPSRGVLRDLMAFTTLPLNSEHPFPPCSDEPELCDQSTMPTLTPTWP